MYVTCRDRIDFSAKKKRNDRNRRMKKVEGARERRAILIEW